MVIRKSRYQTAAEIFEELEQLHRDLSAWYQRRAEGAADERTRMLMAYLVEREEEHATILHRTLEQFADDPILNTWETSGEQMDAVSTLQRAAEDLDNEKPGDPLAATRRIDQMLIDYYELLARESRIDRLKEIFDNLRQGQEQALTQMQMAVARFQDI
jgi:rubrerythrin